MFLVTGGLSAYRACLLVSLAPATFRYQAHPQDDTELNTRVRDLATRYPRYGYRRITALLRRTERVNHKRVRRIWRQRQLQVKRLRRLRPRRSRSTQLQATHPGQIWTYDFVEDALATGTPFKVLTVMDEFTFLRAGARRGAHNLGGTGDWRAGSPVCPAQCAELSAE
jgi:putative transposase